MSKNFKEHRPLLSDDYSDEELQFGVSSPTFRRLRHTAKFGRARIHAKGAAAIFNRWPDHISSLLSYWWVGFGMFALMVFIIYNSILIIYTLPSVRPKPLRVFDHEITFTSNVKAKPNIFMHIIINSQKEAKIDNHLKYIDAFSNRYPNFMYNIILLHQDSLDLSTNDFSDESNNENALNLLWSENKIENKTKLKENAYIENILLSKYMDDSPLKVYWRHLPQHFFIFLVRCIAIWEKGGIAFDPAILTENSPSEVYLEKIERILLSYDLPYNKKTRAPKQKVNNIQDVIDNLESFENTNINEESLLEAENHLIDVLHFNRNEVKRHTNNSVIDSKNQSYTGNTIENRNEHEYMSEFKFEEEITTKSSFLPLFLKYLFREPKNLSTSLNVQSTRDKNLGLDKEISDITIKQHLLNNNSRKEKVSNEIKNSADLIIDIKGYLIATTTPCHAFIGTIFGNIFHHTSEESISDLIISELTIFCKGVLSICQGIETIVL